MAYLAVTSRRDRLPVDQDSDRFLGSCTLFCLKTEFPTSSLISASVRECPVQQDLSLSLGTVVMKTFKTVAEPSIQVGFKANAS